MKLKIEGSFRNRKEMEQKKEQIKNLLLAMGDFKDVKAYEDLITGEFNFECSTGDR